MKNIIKVSNTAENMSPIIRDILNNLNDDCENIIEFEKGTYKFYREGSEKTTLFSSGGKTCENNAIFHIKNKKNLTIEGSGSEFVFCDRVQPFLTSFSENIAFKNFSIDFSFMRYAYAEVGDVKEDGFTLLIDDSLFEYYVDNGNICFVCGNETISTKYKKISTKCITPKIPSIVYLYVGDNEAPLNMAAPHIYVDAEKIDGGVFLRYRANNENKTFFEKGYTICLAYDNDREAQSLYNENSRNITLENVSIYRQGGMGFVADSCENISIDNLKIQIKPGRNEFYPTTADGIFITNCAGKFELKNSHIEGTYDDAMNIHGCYTAIKEVLSDNSVMLEHGHSAHWGLIPCRVGDELHFNDPESLDEITSAIVESITFDEKRENIVVTFENAVNLNKGMLVENPSSMPDVLIENNTIVNCPHMRLSSKNMLVKDNTLTNVQIYVNDIIKFWFESGAVDYAKICGNKFAHDSLTNIVIRSHRTETSNHLHKRIEIKDNSFAETREKSISYEGVLEFVEENNSFES